MHELLRRQLTQHLGALESIPASLSSFLEAVDETYRAADVERARLERPPTTAPREEVLRRIDDHLRASEQQFRHILQHSRILALLLDDKGRITFCNAYFLQLTGYAENDVLGRDYFEAFAPEGERAERRAAMQSWLERAEQELDLESEIVTREGHRRVIVWNHTASRGEDNALQGLAAIGIDVTESRRAREALRRSEQRLSLHVQNTPLAVIEWNLAGEVMEWNQAAEKIFGWRREEVLGSKLQLLSGRSHDSILRMAFEAEAHESAPRSPQECLTRTGQTILCEWYSTPLHDENDSLAGVHCLVLDVTERVRAEEALRESQERYALAAQGANDGIWDWDLTRNELYVSERFKEMLGLSLSEERTTLERWLSRIVPEDVEQLRADMAAHIEGHTPHFENEHRMLHGDGSYRWMLCRGIAVRDANGRATRVAGSQTDITDRKRVEARLRHDAMHDALTGLPNRVYFADVVQRALSHHRRRHVRHFAVLFLDVDRFKVVNDSLGHLVGDQLLVMVAQRLQQSVRPGDVVARLGGDEFTVLLDDLADPGAPVFAAERILRVLALPFNVRGEELFVSASIGIAVSSTGYGAPDEILRDADTAMYRAKAMGKGCYALFDAAMHQRAVALQQLEGDLRRALERQEFHLRYQPIVELETGRLSGFEALLRWNHPQRGIVSPEEFIPVAEETGIIVDIGRWVITEACQQLQQWRQRFPSHSSLTMSVNLSPRQFTQPDLVAQIERIFQETGLPPRSFCLEVTESVIVDDIDAAASLLRRLRALGVRILVDDFGTGYSSLSYLHRFEFDALKIDRSFVRDSGEDRSHDELVRTIVLLARNLGKTVVAEGVETSDQMAMLRSAQCQFGQGFYFAGALLPPEVETWLTDHTPHGTQGRSYTALVG